MKSGTHLKAVTQTEHEMGAWLENGVNGVCSAQTSALEPASPSASSGQKLLVLVRAHLQFLH